MIRPADIHDILPITLLWSKMISETFSDTVLLDKEELDRFAFAIADRLRMENVLTLVAEDKSRVVGFIHGYVQQRPYGKPRSHVFCECLYIEPKYRGKGIKKELVNALISWAEKQELPIEFMTKYDTDLVKIWAKFQAKPYCIVLRIVK